MRAVVLASGGMDSTLLACLAAEEKYEVFPLFINYGQIAYEKEYASCKRAMKRLGFNDAKLANLEGFGDLVPSGLTNTKFDIVKDAFTPGRNTLFLLCAASYAAKLDANVIMIGLLDEEYHLFSDQTVEFIQKAEDLLSHSVGRSIEIKAPLMTFSKQEIVAMSEAKSIGATYSCHKGNFEPCGVCIACREFEFKEV